MPFNHHPLRETHDASIAYSSTNKTVIEQLELQVRSEHIHFGGFEAHHFSKEDTLSKRSSTDSLVDLV